MKEAYSFSANSEWQSLIQKLERQSYIMIFPIVLLATIVKSVPPLWLTIFSFHHKLRFSLWGNIGITALMVFVFSGFSYFMVNTGRLEGIREVYYALTILLISIFMLLIFLKNALKDLVKVTFIAFLVKSMTDSITLTAEFFRGVSFVHDALENLFDRDILTIVGFSELLFDAFFMFLAIPFIWWLIKHYLQPLICSTETMTFWNYLWIIPVSFFLMLRFIVYPSYFFKGSFSYHYRFTVSLIWILCIFTVYLIILKMLLETANNLQLQKELELSNLHIEMQKERFGSLQKSIELMRKTHHDSRHQVIILQGYLKNRDIHGIGEALNMRLEYLDTNNYKPYCENYTLDAIIWNYVKLSEENGIDIFVDVRIPNDTFVAPLDLCVLFGNLIENSVEACCRQTSGKRFIEIRAEAVNPKTIALSIRNSYEGKILKNGSNFLSSKRAEEGIGIKSVSGIVNKYNGTIKIEYYHGIFKSTVLLIGTP